VNLSFNRKDALRLLRHLARGRTAGDGLRVVALGARLHFETDESSADMEALVLEPGAFTVNRQVLARLLRSFEGKDSLTLSASAREFRLNGFKGQVRGYESRPKLGTGAKSEAPEFDWPAPDAPGVQSAARLGS
jgi:hypothetical protein